MLFRWLTWAISGQPRYLLTTRPYPVEAVESLSAAAGSVESGFLAQVVIELSAGSELLAAVGGGVVSGKYGDTTYTNIPELLGAVGGGVVSGKYGDIRYSATPEEVYTTGGGVISGKYGDIHYNPPTDDLNSTGGSVVGGIHE